MNLSEHTKGISAVLITALLWSTGGLFIKLITLTPMQISFFRSGIAAIVFLILFRKKVFQVNRLSVLNSIFYTIVLITFVYATKTTTAANAIFLQSTAPIYVLIFEPLISESKYERINVITIAVCIIGMILFFTGDLQPGDLKGNLVALLSGIFFAAFFLGMKKNDVKYQTGSIFWGNIFVALVCIPFMFDLKGISSSELLMVSYLGIFQIAVAYAIFTYGLKRIFAVEASILSMLEPVLNPGWVLIGYGEVPSTMAIIGGLIIISAITIRTLIQGAGVLRSKFNF